MQRITSIFSNLPISAIRILIVWTLWLVMPATIQKLGAVDNASAPSWRQGVSRWNGSGYDLPAGTRVPAASASFGTAAATGDVPAAAPYTVPVDPTSKAWSNPYLAMPVSDDKGSAPSTRTQDSAAPPAEVNFAPPEIEPKDLTIELPKLDRPLVNAPGGPPPTTATDNKKIAGSGESTKRAEIETAEELPLPEKSSKKKDETLASGSAPVPTIEEEIASTNLEPAPLQEEVTRWYQYPMRWMKGWDSHAEIGLDGSNGNADTLAFQTGLELKRKTDLHTLGIDVNYRQVSSRDVTTEDNGRFRIDYDRLFPDSPWGAFGKYGMEWDKFKTFDLRVWVNGGLGYHWIDRDDATLVTRFGAGASQEIGAPDDDWVAEAVFGIEAERQLTARQKLKGRVDYFPAWENFENYRLVSDIAWETLLDGSDNLSLRVAATDRYDSTPQGAKPNDIYYSLVLLYKF